MGAINKQRRIDTRDFKVIKTTTNPMVKRGKSHLKTYLQAITSPNVGTIETFMRVCLEEVKDYIEKWMVEEIGFKRKSLSNFPDLDSLIYHEDGWTLRSAIKSHRDTYNTTRAKQPFIQSLYNILDLESDRLRNTIFDTLNEKENRFRYVTIKHGEQDASDHPNDEGESCPDCHGACDKYIGTYDIKRDLYMLPPYHAGCHCYAVYSDDPNA